MIKLPDSLTTKVGRATLIAGKHSPTLMFAGGVVGVVGAAVLACRATLKLEETVEVTQRYLDDAKSLQHDNYTEKDRKQDLAYIYIRQGTAIVKLYAPAVGLGVLSIGLLTGSHVQLTKRNAALAGAYAALEKGFSDYRKRVAEEFGEDKERELRYDAERSKEKGTDGKKKEVVKVGAAGASIYARFFDQLCTPWSPDVEYNRLFLQCQQNYANDKLRARGHVFLNEVYDMLDIPRSKAGAVVGWVITKDSEGDNYIDFGIFNSDDPLKRDFVNGREGAILLDFNVDGVIYDKI